jgi:hypothetical protein
MFQPAQATAIAFVISYAVNLAICFAYSSRRHAFRPSRALLIAWFTGLLLVIAAAIS